MRKLFTIVKESAIIISLIIIALVLLPYFTLVITTHNKILEPGQIGKDSYDVGIVLGAGVDKDGDMSQYLRDRLDTAIELYNEGIIKQIIVSGNNSEETNHETDVMQQYLLDNEIPDYAILEDPLGNRTFDSCARAKEVYGLDQVILVTQRFHLYRALKLCNELGVNSVGIAANKDSYSDGWFYTLREIFAAHKAFLDLYLIEPSYSKDLY